MATFKKIDSFANSVLGCDSYNIYSNFYILYLVCKKVLDVRFFSYLKLLIISLRLVGTDFAQAGFLSNFFALLMAKIVSQIKMANFSQISVIKF